MRIASTKHIYSNLLLTSSNLISVINRISECSGILRRRYSGSAGTNGYRGNAQKLQ